MPVLRYQHPTKGVTFIELGARPITMGRSQEADVPIEDNMLSRKHCEVKYNAGSFVLTDLKSKNGTFVNGTPVSTWQLKHGDLISIGNTQFLFKDKK